MRLNYFLKYAIYFVNVWLRVRINKGIERIIIIRKRSYLLIQGKTYTIRYI